MTARTIIVWVVILGALAVATIEFQRSERLDFRPNFEHDATEPVGAHILYDILPDLLGGAEIARSLRSPYATLRDTALTGTTYFFLTQHVDLDSVATAVLVDFARRGNSVFLSGERVSPWVQEALDIYIAPFPFTVYGGAVQGDTLHLAGPRLSRPGGYAFEGEVGAGRIDFDSTRAIPLGRDGLGRPNYVFVREGEGGFFVHLAPRAFGNYHLLRGDGAEYAAAALSHLPAQPVIWDAVLKPQRTAGDAPMRFILETPPLAWAYYTLLLGVLLFVLFRGRRWQRPIPVVRPPANESVRFARAIARLWHERGDDRLLVERRLQHLQERLRRRLHEPGLELSPRTATEIARRLALPEEVVQNLADLAERLTRERRPSARDLLRLDHLLDELHHAL